MKIILPRMQDTIQAAGLPHRAFAQPLCRRIPRWAASASLTILISGCSTHGVKPTDLRVPERLSCIQVAQPLQASELRGPFKAVWETRLANGPYISEREDERGTFYRGPPGAYSLAGDPKKADGSNTVAQVLDGGIYVPRDSTAPPILYVYYSMEKAEVFPVPMGTDCSSGDYVRAALGGKLHKIASVSGKADSGEQARAIAERNMNNNNVSGSSLVGGAVGSAIVAAAISKDLGNIVLIHTPADPGFAGALKALTRESVSVQFSQ